MEKFDSFVTEVTKEQPTKTPKEYILDEMRADVRLFPKEIQNIIRGSGEQKLEPAEQGNYDKERAIWWQKKYGFPYEHKAARSEVILRKYGNPVERTAAHLLQEDLLDALKNNDTEKIAILKKTYAETYPDQLEGVEAIFGLQQFFADQDRVVKEREEKSLSSDERGRLFIHLTEYNFLLSDFIRANSADKPFLIKFWSVLETIAREADRPDRLGTFHMLQRAIATQVATGKIFEQLGEHPRLSHPSEDALKAIDLWIDNAAVQIKGTSSKQVGFLKTDEISFPGIEISKEGVKEQAKTYHINSDVFHQAQQFHTKLSKYRELIKKDVQGYFLVVPYNKIDFITGEPAPDLVEFVRQQVATELT